MFLRKVEISKWLNVVNGVAMHPLPHVSYHFVCANKIWLVRVKRDHKSGRMQGLEPCVAKPPDLVRWPTHPLVPPPATN